MKTLLTYTILLTLVSCGSTHKERRIDDAAWDSLADESYLRWGQERLKQSAKSGHQVMQCYQGEASKTLRQYKKDYLQKNQETYYWLHVGNCFFVQEEWTKAEFYYRMAIEETKATTIKSIAYNNLGLISFKYEQWEKGKAHLKESMNLASKFKVPRYNLSQLYLQFGLYDKAIEVLNEKAFQGHKDLDVYFSLANAHLYKGDLENAKHYFSMLPKKSFRREDIAATYALYLIRTGNLKEAKEVLDDRERSNVVAINNISQKIEKMLSQRMKEE